MPCELETIRIARTQRRLADSGHLPRKPWAILCLPWLAIFWHYSCRKTRVSISAPGKASSYEACRWVSNSKDVLKKVKKAPKRPTLPAMWASVVLFQPGTDAFSVKPMAAWLLWSSELVFPY